MSGWQQHLQEVLGVKIVSAQPLGGGDFAASYSASLADGERIFVKTHANPPAHFFTTEATGLQWLRETGTVNIPQVLAVSDDPPCLALQWVEPGAGKQDDTALGAALAQLHRQMFEHFGRPDRRTTGSLALSNQPESRWADFYANRRLHPLSDIAEQRDALPARDCQALRTIADNLAAASIADDSASLLHGDLWAGNRLVDSSGQSWLIDPAAHGGHREFDLAMMLLFGGYAPECFTAYHAAFPLKAGFEERVPMHQLAPLVVHAIKFGASYVQAVRKAIRQTESLLDLPSSRG